MKKKFALILAAIIPLAALTNYYVKDSTEKKAIEDVVLRSYVNGAFNDLDPEAMLEGFHSDFAIFYAEGEDLGRYEIEIWVEGVKKRKSSSDFDPSKNVWKHKFAIVDITGGAAIVKVELTHEGEHVYTDYLSLLKFESGWKIVGKVYYKHPGEET